MPSIMNSILLTGPSLTALVTTIATGALLLLHLFKTWVTQNKDKAFLRQQLRIIACKDLTTGRPLPDRNAARTIPNRRLKPTFGIDNIFTTEDTEWAGNFRKLAIDTLIQTLRMDSTTQNEKPDWSVLVRNMRSAVQQYLQAERDSVNLAKLVQFVTLKVSIGYLSKVPEQDLSKKKDAIISIANRINDLWILSKGSGGDERSIPAWDEEQDIIQNLLTVIPDHNREISTGTRIGLSRMATSTMDDARWATVAPPAHLDSCCVGDVLDTSHQNVFATAMSNLLSTDIAEQTFAQIIDGLPLRDVAFSLRSPQYTRRDPVFAHTELCPGVLERTRMFRDSFSPREMELRTDVCINREQHIMRKLMVR